MSEKTGLKERKKEMKRIEKTKIKDF